MAAAVEAEAGAGNGGRGAPSGGVGDVSDGGAWASPAAAALCFDPSVFRPAPPTPHAPTHTTPAYDSSVGGGSRDDFDVAQFVQGILASHAVPLEELRADLSRFVTLLKSEVRGLSRVIEGYRGLCGVAARLHARCHHH